MKREGLYAGSVSYHSHEHCSGLDSISLNMVYSIHEYQRLMDVIVIGVVV